MTKILIIEPYDGPTVTDIQPGGNAWQALLDAPDWLERSPHEQPWNLTVIGIMRAYRRTGGGRIDFTAAALLGIDRLTTNGPVIFTGSGLTIQDPRQTQLTEPDIPAGFLQYVEAWFPGAKLLG